MVVPVKYGMSGNPTITSEYEHVKKWEVDNKMVINQEKKQKKSFSEGRTSKWSSWVVPIGTQKIQDGGRRPLKKTVKPPYLCNRLTDFDEIWYSDAHWTRTADVPLKFL